ncbi:hypothetical protein NL108_015336 [Boleophthalmus pectinirostris]|uniref:CKLF-like MARVEL transmembrane domain-containing protein 6 isoform X1 n=1 Tax=Boleophthalmus pectinirostris TaxID=150288 RepID=UPI000A1C5D06|nr:CKLF-like MARVEL transmembrane domain-containing protein 6 isoform X1 [Boleophthalmus pectinirostris]KAJ0066583.1 hypothetical protein NL108_015336 [Boleophthalmus pectinirostris]
MADTVYAPTTAPNPKDKCFLVPNDLLDLSRFFLKLAQVVLSFVAFVQEELVSSCASCGPLYFFEFVSCSAFLFTTLLLVLLATALHRRVGVARWSALDFLYTSCIFVLFFIASISFSAKNSGTNLEKSAAVFGFLASLFFGLDLFFFYRTHGLPWKPAQNQENPTNEAPAPEAEKLNENGA